jgi:hypothetical protein
MMTCTSTVTGKGNVRAQSLQYQRMDTGECCTLFAPNGYKWTETILFVKLQYETIGYNQWIHYVHEHNQWVQTSNGWRHVQTYAVVERKTCTHYRVLCTTFTPAAKTFLGSLSASRVMSCKFLQLSRIARTPLIVTEV